MSMLIKKRQIVMATLVVALGAAVFVNWYFTKPASLAVDNSTTGTNAQEESLSQNLGDAQYVNGTTTSNQGTTNQTVRGAEYYAQAKLRRTTAHDEAREALNDIIKDKSSSADAIEQATQALTKLANAIKLEADTENLIKAKLNSECVVIINGNKAEVIADQKALNDTAILQIKEIVIKQAGIPAENITIIEVK